jgi:hypothetical protein
MGQKRGQPDLAGVAIDGGGLDGCDLVLAKALADNIKSTCERGIAEGSAPSRENGERIAAAKDISGLVSSP